MFRCFVSRQALFFWKCSRDKRVQKERKKKKERKKYNKTATLTNFFADIFFALDQISDKVLF
jgi:hypothetical protein